MAFQSLCQKIDVDSLRATFSNLPSLPAMRQLKLPRSLLRTRKIFRSSKENIDVNKSASLEAVIQSNSNILQLPQAIPPAQFIDHTPQRISTISSLMYEHEGATYRSANSIDDDYPSPRQYNRSTACLKPISPIKSMDLMNIPDTHQSETTSNNPSIVQRIQKGYKDATEFRFKHIFSKKTVIRKDSIHVDEYVENYTEERSHNHQFESASSYQERLEDFRFQFKESRQKSDHSYSLSSNESASSNKQNKNETDDEEGNKFKTQLRRPGIFATRFSRVNNPPKKMSDDKNDNYEEQMHDGDIEIRQSTIYAIKDYQISKITSLNETPTTEIPLTRREIYKNRLRRLTKYATSSIDESGVESSNCKTKVKTTKERKRKAPLTPEQSVETNVNDKHETKLVTIKKNIKRFHKSFKNHQPSADESAGEDAGVEKPKTSSRTDKICERLRKFKSFNESVDNDEPEKKQEVQFNPNSPKQTVINKKISQFKKSFKKQTSEVDNRTGDEATPEKHTRTNALIKNFRHIRSKKNDSAVNDENKIKTDENNRKVSKFEQKFDQARKRTLKKVNERMEKIGFYKKSQENIAQNNNIQNHSSEDEDENGDGEHTNQQELDEEDMYEVASLEQDYATRAIWTSKPILSDDKDNESDSDTEYPRVLIHQDTSDLFESTLVLAVTRSPKPFSTPRTKIIEILPKPIINEETPNIEKEKNLKKFPPPRQRRLSEGNPKTQIQLFPNKNSKSALSVPALIDQNPMSQIQQNLRRDSVNKSSLVKEDESEDPWKVAGTFKRNEQIYKAKSIDIFEKSKQKNGDGTAFEDFDEILKNEPVVKIPLPTAYSLDIESSEDTDAADDDNSSRVTKILSASKTDQTELSNSATTSLYVSTDKHTKIFSNSRESLLANSTENMHEYTDDDDDNDDDRPPSAAPSPPPSPVSLIPPPLPKRQSNVTEQCNRTPPLPDTNPPILAEEPPKIPDRTASMSRILKPLVKTSSMRLAYSEQVNPEDVGKVNKLISRFEHPKSEGSQRPRIIPRKKLRSFSDAYSEDEETSSSDEHSISSKDNIEANPHHMHVLEIRNPLKANTQSADTSLHTKLSQGSLIITTPPISRDNNDFVEIMPKKSENLLGLAKQRITIYLDQNSNSSSSFSCPNSAYGSPLEFPSSLTGSPETTPVPDRKRKNLQNRRTVARDDDVYLSFDSDEENSYYSISPAGSNRFIVDL